MLISQRLPGVPSRVHMYLQLRTQTCLIPQGPFLRFPALHELATLGIRITS